MNKSFYLYILCTFFFYGCFSAFKAQELLDKRMSKLYLEGKYPLICRQSYKKPILFYFKEPLLSIIQSCGIIESIPKGDTLCLFYSYGLDLRQKSLVYSNLDICPQNQDYAKRLISEKEIPYNIYTRIKIKKSNIFFLNFPLKNIRGENNIYYNSHRIRITSDTIFYMY